MGNSQARGTCAGMAFDSGGRVADGDDLESLAPLPIAQPLPDKLARDLAHQQPAGSGFPGPICGQVESARS
jgi:hypothetical protein